jgi:hypothetical protein
MKATCTTNRSGYEYDLTEGKEYEVLDIQDSIWPGAYYIQVMGDRGRKAFCHLYRFDVTKEQAEAYVVEHHSDWREADEK